MAEFPRAFGSRLKSSLQPTNTEILAFRPLNFGADTVHPRILSKLVKLENFYADEDGWKLRPALTSFMAQIPIETGEVVNDYIDMGIVSRFSTFNALGSKYLYNTNDGVTWRRAPYGKDYFETASLSGTALVCDDDLEVDYLVTQALIDVGAFYLMFDDGTDTYPERIEISAVSGAALTLGSVPVATHPAKFRIFYEFRAVDPYVVQWTIGPDRKLYLVDGSNIGIMNYDGRYLNRLELEDQSGDPASFSGAYAIQYLDGRLVVGNTIESESSDGYRTVRWSDATSIATFDDNNYVVMSLSTGLVMSIKTLENYLIVSTQDDIYMGKPYNVGDLVYSMPWIFKRLETAGRVPVGQKAITSALNSIFYIASDDVYMLSFTALNAQGDFVVTPLNCPVKNQIFTSVSSIEARDMHLSSIVYSQETNLVMFAFEKPFSSIWAMHAKTGAWSNFVFNQSMETFARSIFVPRETYASIDPTWTYDEASIASRSYLSFIIGFGTHFVVFIDQAGDQYIMDSTSFVDSGDAAIVGTIETGDMDFDAPDDIKSLYKLGVLVNGSGTMTLQGSTDRGGSWKWLTPPLGSVAIDDEQEIHFRLSGAKLALKMTFPTVSSRIIVEALTMSLKTVGESVIRGGN